MSRISGNSANAISPCRKRWRSATFLQLAPGVLVPGWAHCLPWLGQRRRRMWIPSLRTSFVQTRLPGPSRSTGVLFGRKTQEELGVELPQQRMTVCSEMARRRLDARSEVALRRQTRALSQGKKSRFRAFDRRHVRRLSEMLSDLREPAQGLLVFGAPPTMPLRSAATSSRFRVRDEFCTSRSTTPVEVAAPWPPRTGFRKRIVASGSQGSVVERTAMRNTVGLSVRNKT